MDALDILHEKREGIMLETLEGLLAALWWSKLSDEQKAQIGALCEDS